MVFFFIVFRWIHLSTPLIRLFLFVFFFFNETASTEIYTLSLHDALPICQYRLFQRYSLLAPPMLSLWGPMPLARSIRLFVVCVCSGAALGAIACSLNPQPLPP